MGPEAEAARVTVAVEENDGVPSARGEAERLRQVLINLARNAIEAMREHGGRLTMRARNAGNFVELDVEDDGRASPRSFRCSTPSSRQGTGNRPRTGAHHRIVADHGGTIQVQSQAGRNLLSRSRFRSTVRPSLCEGLSNPAPTQIWIS